MTIHKLDLSMFGKTDLLNVAKIVTRMANENTGYKRGPQIILLDDSNGDMTFF